MSKGLKDLQREWYAILAKEGFKDIEQSFEYHSQIFMRKKTKQNVAMDEAQEYYIRALEFAHEYDFDTLEDKQVWLLHAQGESCRKIAASIKQKKLKKSTINNTIVRLRKIMLQSF
jgi:2'-5' RNA ligase